MDNQKKYKLHKQICDDLHELYVTKNMEYGDSFSKAYNELGMIAPIVDMYHKLQRIISIHDKDEVTYESVEDSLRDLANYSLMALLELKMEDDTDVDTEVDMDEVAIKIAQRMSEMDSI